ncbi:MULTISPECIES: RNA polymerase sigma factor [Bacillaceae]|uniref:RNA polymerase sigma-70 factor n=2 Tax=Bacillus infantis TaxID=324767 RepID=U5L521_9BACI|nr:MULTISPECIES: RNA polymerase sigma factor [Bacillus]OXT17517.1 RNA polymerase subunit sigma-70 [Bacillus sp. OG2]AGX02415.1 RNA polymerase sigma-70 factor [Bacillus infantis NRRL B-14911]EAR67476.1 RNA polymerase sigma-70 factor [Bacillus sp. NRRL B-14911]MCK6207406.1 RNA polymerase sigma factor [Bacillus infantis]MDW2878697.1 RNA polymerase sigma factor [Bacillus infantis]
MHRDLKLIQKIIKKGNEEAANELVSLYYREIYHYVYKQTLDQEQSKDLTQEIFINMLHGLHQFEGKRALFRTWLYKIATYKIVDYYRSKHYKASRRMADIEDLEIGSHEDSSESILQKEEIEAVLAVLDRMEASYQQIFRMKLFGEQTFQEIASSLQVPESTVKTKYYRSLKFIREEAKKEGFTHAER